VISGPITFPNGTIIPASAQRWAPIAQFLASADSADVVTRKPDGGCADTESDPIPFVDSFASGMLDRPELRNLRRPA
jgi:hypothetical protein